MSFFNNQASSFGQSQPSATPFGGSGPTASTTPFGSTAPAAPAFGAKPATPAPATPSLFNTNQQNSGSSLFNSAAAPATPSTSNSLFGASAPAGSFGDSNKIPAASGMFGQAASNTSTANKPLFGSASNTFGQPPQSSLFGNSQTGAGNSSSTNTGFGSFGAGNSGTNNAGFGNSAPNNAGFGNSNMNNSGLNKPSLFGNSANTTTNQAGQFGTAAAQPAAPSLIATVDQASFTLPGVAPSSKLYTSLSAPLAKRSASHEREITRSRLHPRLGGHARSTLRAGPPQELPASLAGPYNSNAQSLAAAPLAASHAEPRKWINSYDAFLRERPTTLVIDRKAQIKSPHLLLPANASLPKPAVSSAPPPLVDDLVGDRREELEAADSPNDPDVSLFHRRANNMTLVQVNPQAISDGYYVYPRLEVLASMPKDQLRQVRDLKIGRRDFGQIEFCEPVDLSQLKNLGDILGKLVVFAPGTVCVYPETGRQCPPGRELNQPAIVSLENVWPKDARTHQPVTDVEDKRIHKLVVKLKESCEQRGGEFITFQKGTWVFKVPHFSTWGLPADEMIVDDNIGDELGEVSDESGADQSIFGQAGHQSQANDGQDVPRVDPLLPPHAGSEKVLPHFASSPILGALDGDGLVMSDADLGEELPSEGLDAAPEESESAVLTSVPHSWLEQLSHAVTGVLEAKAQSLAAASQPTNQLNLGDMLLPMSTERSLNSPETNESLQKPASAIVNTLPFASTATLAASTAVLSQLKPSLHVTPRPTTTDLPLLRCQLDFSKLYSLYPSRQSLWQLLSILYESEPSSTLDKLKAWFDQDVQRLPIDLSKDALTACWQLISRHDIVGAYAYAARSQNPHLALLVAMLTSAKTAATMQENAQAQIQAWQSHGFQSGIPPALLRIWELVAGIPPSELNLQWNQWLGIHFWYLNPSSVAEAVRALPESLAESAKPAAASGGSLAELAFLRYYSQAGSLTAAFAQLNLVEAFLCLQAIGNTNPAILSDHTALYDDICSQLAQQLLTENQYVNAVLVALHIKDSLAALDSVRQILCTMPLSLNLPDEFGVPAALVYESRATQVARQGQYTLQCEHLLAANRLDEAHKVLLANVAPHAVLSQQLSSCIPLLEALESHQSQIDRWDLGGGVYLRFARALAASDETDNYTVMALCNACRYITTPTLESQQAVSRMAEWVANTAYAQHHIKPEMILGMKFAPSQARIEVLEQAAHLLF